MPIQPSKKAVKALRELNSTFRLRMQFLENADSVALRTDRRKNHQTIPPPEGEYRTHVEIVDTLTGKSYVNVVGGSGEPEVDIIDRAIDDALKVGRPATASERASSDEQAKEIERLKAELAKYSIPEKAIPSKQRVSVGG